jgi:hypothetical protein
LKLLVSLPLLIELGSAIQVVLADVETSASNVQAWLKHPAVLPKLLSTFAAQTLAARYDADPSAADCTHHERSERSDERASIGPCRH